MGLRTPEQFRQSLKDKRVVWAHGHRVEDVTVHPGLRVGVETACVDYAVAEDAACRTSTCEVSSGVSSYERD